MSLPVKTGMPDDIEAGDGWTIRFTAVDPTTGALVSGVTVSLVNIGAELLSGGEAAAGRFMLVPGPGA